MAAYRARSLGIIPARAGFTSPRRICPTQTGDHPRSRGVYPPARRQWRLAPGSSPLARGLPTDPGPRPRPTRIIPARAGFTDEPGRRRQLRGDHPRSRGVYVARPARSSSTSGSSPLARGLLGRAELIVEGDGIIPARAGFTSWRRPCTATTTDHPRSRGVYAPSRCTRTAPAGSSPLARGLLGFHQRHPGADRIIPARAGFTRKETETNANPQDHPRSRGVY